MNDTIAKVNEDNYITEAVQQGVSGIYVAFNNTESDSDTYAEVDSADNNINEIYDDVDNAYTLHANQSDNNQSAIDR